MRAAIAPRVTGREARRSGRGEDAVASVDLGDRALAPLGAASWNPLPIGLEPGVRRYGQHQRTLLRATKYIPSMKYVAMIAAIAGCSHGAVPEPTIPACVRAETTDAASGVTEWMFDSDGNLTTVVESDNAGHELARTTIAWSPTEIVVTRGGAFANTQRGVLGAHGELLAWDRAKLAWNGTFAPVRGRFAMETYYHLVGDEPLLPLDTSLRGVWPRMRAFAFTGSVVLHRDGHPDTRANYDRGHQVELSIGGALTRTTWRDDQPTEQTSGTEHVTFTSAHGHITRLAGGHPDVTYTYDAGNLTHVRTDYVGLTIDVDVSRCSGH
jgi:hypothetical protein